MVFLQQLHSVSMHFPAFQFSCWDVPLVSHAANISVIFFFLPFFLTVPQCAQIATGSAWFWVGFLKNLTVAKKWIIKKNTKSPGCFPPDNANIDEMLSYNYLSDLLR